MDEALAFARSVAYTRPLPLVRNLPCKHPQGDAYFQFARNMVRGMSKNFPALLKCVDAVEAATKNTFADGMAMEHDLFIQLMWTSESRSLRHLFLAERAASKIPDVPADTPKRDIKAVAVIGAGTMECWHSSAIAGNEAGSFGQRHRDDTQKLRSAGQEGQAQGRQIRAAHGIAEQHAGLCRAEGRRPGD